MIQRGVESPLERGWAAREEHDAVLEGGLYCTHSSCRLEYPVVDGLPILFPDAQAFVAENVFHLLLREDLGPRTESLIGECCGPGSALDTTRLHLSSYTWDHYAEFDSGERIDDATRPGSIARAWARIEALAPAPPAGATLEVGCSVGRIAFDIGESSKDVVLGMDINVSMLRTAQHVLRTGSVVYPRRSGGLVYERREFGVPFHRRDRVDFWAGDGAALPFATGTFARVVGMNVLDSVASPLDFLRSMRRVTRPGGQLLLAAPYDWSGAVTQPPAWIGGHSVRAAGEGSSAAILRALLTPGAHPASLEGIRIVGELDDLPWFVRMHDRSVTLYRLHAVAAIVES